MPAAYRILVGSYTDSIYTLEFDPARSSPDCSNVNTAGPSLTYLSKAHVGDYPSWIEAHPSDRSLVFACLEQAPDGQIVAVKYDEDGNGRKIDEVTCSSGGANPCTLIVNENELLVGNYGGGNLGTMPISTNPPYTRPADLQTLAFPFEPGLEPGQNPSRQEASHPHQTVFRPLTQELLVPDLGSDKVWRLTKEEGSDGRAVWVVRDFIRTKTGGGPRHVAIYGNTLYVLLELTCELAAYSVDSIQQQQQLPIHLTTVSTIKQPPLTPSQITAAEILIPKPNHWFPTAYIYTSNRDDPHPQGDTIAIFSLKKGEEHPELVAEVRTGLRHVRGMAFGGQNDEWLVVGGVGGAGKEVESGGGIKIYERVEGGRGLRQIAELDNAVGSKLRATTFLWL